MSWNCQRINKSRHNLKEAVKFTTYKQKTFIFTYYRIRDRLCDLVVRVLGYRSGGSGSIPETTRKKKVMGLERGALSLN
jgi:hypothetical protein